MNKVNSSDIQQEASAFDKQIEERIQNGHIPDLRQAGRCEYFYNNIWRDQEFAKLYYGSLVDQVLDSAKKYIPNKKARILEVGCGPGHVSLELSRYGHDVTGIDVSSKCIEIAEDVAAKDPYASERGKLEFKTQDLYEHQGEYDIILFVASLHHFPKCDSALSHVKKLLSPDGIIILDEPVRDLVSKRNAAFIFFIKQLLGKIGNYFEEPMKNLSCRSSINQEIDRIYALEKYEQEDGSKVQSVNDNESGYKEISTALSKHFTELEAIKDFSFYHQLIAGVRMNSREEETNFASFLKEMDHMLCANNIIDPVNLFYIGKPK